jgi:hypothetical protein
MLLLAIVLVGTAAWQLWASRRQLAASLGTRSRQTAAAPLASAASPTPQAASQTEAAKLAARRPSAPTLQGIVMGAGEPYALINGDIFKVGDRIGETVLESIQPKSIVLKRDNGKTLALALPE